MSVEFAASIKCFERKGGNPADTEFYLSDKEPASRKMLEEFLKKTRDQSAAGPIQAQKPSLMYAPASAFGYFFFACRLRHKCGRRHYPVK